MALQMLYQWESASTHPSEVLRGFDIELFRAERKRAQIAKRLPPGRATGPRDPGIVLAEDVPLPDAGSDPEPEAEVTPFDDVERQVTRTLGPKARSPSFAFAKELFVGVVEQRETLDQAITRQADNWRIERMSTVDRNILRIALLESRADTSMPLAVIIDEAVELAKAFGGENSSAFVNGVLDGLLVERSGVQR